MKQILTPIHCFGHSPQCGIRDTVFALANHTFIISAGSKLAVRSQAPDGHCEFLPGLDAWEKVTAVAMSKDKSTLAVCVAGNLDKSSSSSSSSSGFPKKTTAPARAKTPLPPSKRHIGKGKKFQSTSDLGAGAGAGAGPGGAEFAPPPNAAIIIYKLPRLEKSPAAAGTAVVEVVKEVVLPKRYRTITYAPEESHQADTFCESAFSTDGKMLYVQAEAPEYTLLVYDWSRSKLLASLELQVEASRICSPMDSTALSRITTSGPSHLCFWSLGPGGRSLSPCPPALGLSPFLVNSSITDHAWAHDGGRVVACTSSGVVLVVDSGRLAVVQSWDSAHGMGGGGGAISCVLTFDKGVTGAATAGDEDDVAGFITLGEGGVFCVFHYNDNDNDNDIDNDNDNEKGDNAGSRFPYRLDQRFYLTDGG
ncbi:hypothetical protein ScalyP_jg11340, partial [Parmales sp. scaly parma]